MSLTTMMNNYHLKADQATMNDNDESHDLFLKFDDTFNNEGSSSEGDTSDGSQPTYTSRRHQHSRNLELKRYVQKNGKIPIHRLGADKPILPHPVRFSNTIGVLTRDTFPDCCLKTTKAIVKHPYNYSSESKSFLQRQQVLTEQRGQQQMLELQSQPTLEGSQPLSEELDMRDCFG
ncbi:(R)-mandelonitrile lyase 1-like [Cucumis melo var. makuwa]|uniref:(R)-mandelonitrile lyase 1-like n=1 Tax=Cucumis melo var. makuwa TaxID=1194695 RepID=A0A5A7U9K6_CUCMM|nr:(R)-mandelonitrile lyase 1-like [Cucumis melo var. makuwa]TYJ98197.1 (R)-mandelonitrile lyase 1-like [Cucumis melo var. makuwa]